jgi:hypothetical protein
MRQTRKTRSSTPKGLYAYATYNEGGSNSDTIQDLNNFAVFGQANAELFIAAKCDIANFTRAAELSNEITEQCQYHSPFTAQWILESTT